MTTDARLSRLSLNQYTTHRWGVREAAEGCARAGIPWIGLWRDKVAEAGLHESARIVRDAGLRVSSLCRGGAFPASTADERRAKVDDNRRAVEEAAELGAALLVLVCGGLTQPGRDLQDAYSHVEEGVAQLIPYAEECGVRLGIEPLHPAFAAERSVVVTLKQANDLVERLGSRQVGVVIDTYHVWWDPELYTEIRRAAGWILAYHVDDWLSPNGDPLMGRGMMGDGVIDLKRITRAIAAAGYSGPVEVEIFNQAIWDAPSDEVLDLMKTRYLDIIDAALFEEG